MNNDLTGLLIKPTCSITHGIDWSWNSKDMFLNRFGTESS